MDGMTIPEKSFMAKWWFVVISSHNMLVDKLTVKNDSII